MSLFDDDSCSLDDSVASSCLQPGIPADFSSSSASSDPRCSPSRDSVCRRNSESPTSFSSSVGSSSDPTGKPMDGFDPGPVSNGCTYSLDERHMIWRKNAALHYAAVLSHKVEWPSMTVEFLTPPSSSATTGRSGSAAALLSLGCDAYVSHRLLLGTCTNGEEKNYLTIAELRWPVPCLEEDPLKCETYSGFIPPRARAKSLLTNAGLSGGAANASMTAASASLASQLVPSLETKARILHPGDLIRATHMPQNAFNIVTINEDGVGMYWNFSRHPSFPAADQVVAKPQFLLAPPPSAVGAKLQAAAWMPGSENAGFLFSCTDTGLVCLWDLRKNGAMFKSKDASSSSRLAHARKTVYGGNVTIAESTPEISPATCVATSSPGAALNDIKAHPRYSVVVATAGEDGALRLFDMRQAHREVLSALSGGPSSSAVPSLSDAQDSLDKDATPPRPAPAFPQAAKQRIYSSLAASDGPLPLNALSFNRHSENVVAVGSARGVVSLFDLRLPTRPFLSLAHHSDEITALHFSPLSSALLASASADGDVVLWDLGEGSRGGAVSASILRHGEHRKQASRQAWEAPLEKDVEMDAGADEGHARMNSGRAGRPSEAADGSMDEAEDLENQSQCANRKPVSASLPSSPSLSSTRRHRVFVHAGHAAGVSDFAWCSEAASTGVGGAGWGGRRSELTEKGRIGTLLGASVGWDNRVQIWQPSEHLFVDTRKELW
ncbi:putative histone-binding protein rba-1, related [Neospora caninum Liverpool]|uniref:Probable histone-binding protein rba-1, related n=1 Tax=Neospora caninum (strain Liverpool) TaxID=572307 RepID=F0VRK1_NEOCL|nr:putative histone-binding protein rba-1, related [Neospora caninum Liverpool]CBZ56349.1 putative histone-binding protein rba-1, related [Neospora caninum Liverpool]CEL71109.1 TPA: Probable histone-binding protein rba-1, related [Neospora caninum Liverpool]|eukprot:XP_003886374.1 putative histone-binding protein rba-1, related [Neospora caninum Liverpool]